MKFRLNRIIVFIFSMIWFVSFIIFGFDFVLLIAIGVICTITVLAASVVTDKDV